MKKHKQNSNLPNGVTQEDIDRHFEESVSNCCGAGIVSAEDGADDCDTCAHCGEECEGINTEERDQDQSDSAAEARFESERDDR